MPDKIQDFQDVIAKVLESRRLHMVEYARVIWRDGQPREHLVSNQEYRRHQAFEFFKPVEDDVDLARLLLLSTLQHHNHLQ